MVCQNCSSENPDNQAFCGKCGHRLTAETVGSLSQRLTELERQALVASQNKITQENLELQTAGNVMERVRKWTTLILAFSGGPAFFGLLALAVFFGKGSFDIYQVAANAKASVGAVVEQAQSKAADAERVAGSALATAKQVDAKILQTQSSVLKLQTEVEARSAEVEALSNRLKAQEAEYHRVIEQARAVQTAQSVSDVEEVYPVLGPHIAQSTKGPINPKLKPPGALWVDIIWTQKPMEIGPKVHEAVSVLQDHNYKVEIGTVWMISRTATSAVNVGMPFDSNSCSSWVKPAARPPCILYFKNSLKDRAIEVRNLVKFVQQVPDDQIIWLDPTKLEAEQRELLERSATDFVVILGQ